jgi:hypothetical protein
MAGNCFYYLLFLSPLSTTLKNCTKTVEEIVDFIILELSLIGRPPGRCCLAQTGYLFKKDD